MREFYVLKESNTFADNLEAVGLAKVIKTIIQKISNNEDDDVTIEDYGGYFKIMSDYEITEDSLKQISFFDFMSYVSKKGESTEQLTFSSINYDIEKEKRDKFYRLNPEEQKKSDSPPRSDYDIVRLYAGMDGYRNSFNNLRLFKEAGFDDLLNYILKYYSNFSSNGDDLVKELNKFIKDKKIKELKKIAALQDINPDKGKGANQPKANSISPKAYNNMLWFRELLKFAGGWESLTSRYFNKDYKTYVLNPIDISLEYFNNIFSSLKKSAHGNSSIKMDISLLLSLTGKLITHHTNYKESWNFFEPKKAISGLSFAYYKNLGQKPAVTNIGFLGIPDFIKINDEATGNKWIDILEEHQERINSIDEKNSSNVKMLQTYRNFISASNFDSFIDFCYEYSVFLISSINNQKYYTRPFSITNLEELMKTNETFEGIFSNKGFIAISRAIRNSTIIPVIHKNKKDVVFGLSNKLKIASRTKESLIAEVSEFIQKYNESVMLKDFHQKEHQKYVTTEELEEFYKLLDSDVSSKTIAGMLVAFGYAKDPKKEDKTLKVNNKEENQNG